MFTLHQLLMFLYFIMCCLTELVLSENNTIVIFCSILGFGCAIPGAWPKTVSYLFADEYLAGSLGGIICSRYYCVILIYVPYQEQVGISIFFLKKTNVKLTLCMSCHQECDGLLLLNKVPDLWKESSHWETFLHFSLDSICVAIAYMKKLVVLGSNEIKRLQMW